MSNSQRMVGKICITTTFDRKYMAGGKTLFKSIRRHTDCTGIDFKVITTDPEVVKIDSLVHPTMHAFSPMFMNPLCVGFASFVEGANRVQAWLRFTNPGPLSSIWKATIGRPPTGSSPSIPKE